MNKRRTFKLALLIMAIGVIALWLWAKARHNVVLDGTLQTSFEESAFFVDGDCSNKPYWWQWPNKLDIELGTRWKELGNPAALRVRIRGNLSSVGFHGHMGKYRREIQPIEVISVSPASRCEWKWWSD